MNFRQMASALMFRSRLANLAGRTFGGKRDLYKVLGYSRELWPWDYRSRYRRNAVANRVVKALPQATWRGGFEVIEDEDPTVETKFEAAWADLEQRLKITSVFERADILAGIGRYSIILIGGPGNLEAPLDACSADEIAYLTPFAEDDAVIKSFEIDVHNPRFGLPLFYEVKRSPNMENSQSVNSATIGRLVHWTRVIHVADGLLDDHIYGEPRLECVWNLLDDLEKVSGGGAEAFWKRADKGIQWELDPTLDMVDESGEVTAETKAMRESIDKYEHKLERNVFTRGVTAKELGSDVADFSAPVLSIIGQISAGTGIPQRVLMGSEQGKLAAKMDRSNWDDRVSNRRDGFASPYIVRPFVKRMIELGAIPAPAAGDFDAQWPQLKILDDEQRSIVAGEWADINSKMGETVVLPNEIRERVLGLAPLEEVQSTAQVNKEPVAAKAARNGVASHTHVHVVADRFRGTRQTYRQRLLLRREKAAQPSGTAESGRSERREGYLESHERSGSLM
jgi:hypothetical protein